MPDRSLIEYAAEYAGLAAPIDCTNRPEVWGPMLVELLRAEWYPCFHPPSADFILWTERDDFVDGKSFGPVVVAAYKAKKEAEREV